jgi:glycosyltransferase involved in cell wall biosynthesis
MRHAKKPVIVFLTAAWQDVDDNIRKGRPPGGVPSIARIWTTCLEQGFEVHVFMLTRLDPGWPRNTVELGGVKFHWVNQYMRGFTDWLTRKGLIGLFKPLWLIWQMQMAFRLMQEWIRPDIIYVMRTTYILLGWLWRMISGARLVRRQYGVFLYESWFEQKKWLPRVNDLGGLLALRVPCDLIIMTNDGTRGDKVAQWIGTPMHKFRFWINGVDKALRIPGFDAGAFKKSLGVPAEAPMLVTLGRLTYWKRIDRAIDAMPRVLKEFPETRLVIVGGGELKQDLEDRATRLGLQDRVVFAGPVTHDKIKQYLNAADVYILPHDVTNMCSTLIEGLTAGCCIVTRDVGSTTELVTHDRNAMVLKPGEAPDIADTVIRLLKDPGLRHRLAQKAYEQAMQRFQTWDERMLMEVQELRALIGLNDRRR